MVPAQKKSAPIGVADRIASLDFIRGIAVLGILASNIVTYARPNEARRVLALVHEPSWNEWFPWLVNYIFIDGKFRGMFAALFGVGLVVFMDRARARGAPPRWLQVRRLIWLMLFGTLHFVFLFEGDILLQYAMLGLVAIWMVPWNPKLLLALGITLLAVDSTLSSQELWRSAAEESAALAAPAGSKTRVEYEKYWQGQREAVTEESQWMAHGGMGEILSHRFTRDGRVNLEALFDPVVGLRFAVLEYLPMMIIGAALYRMGFFSGLWNRRRLLRWGLAGVAFGIVTALSLGLWLKHAGWRFDLNYFVFYGPVHILRLPMVLGYLALMVALAPQLVPTRIGRRFEAAGQMALTNYLGMSFVMAVIFQGWGLGLFDRFNRFEQWGFLVLGCALMLGWSQPWLARHRFGPLEWAWRCLTYWRLFPLRRDAAAREPAGSAP
jgi:uncharacterized protein